MTKDNFNFFLFIYSSYFFLILQKLAFLAFRGA